MNPFRFSRRYGGLLAWAGLAFFVLGLSGCGEGKALREAGAQKSLAIFAEFAKERNLLMRPGLNRRVFNTVEAQVGGKIALNADGSITLQPGRYRISGFSMVTMQAGLATPTSKFNLNYPGYAMVYPREFEASDPLQHQVGVGCPSTALDMTPSLFDLVLSCDKVTQLCVGHQSGEELHDEVYLSVYSVDGVVSPFHVFARVAIEEL